MKRGKCKCGYEMEYLSNGRYWCTFCGRYCQFYSCTPPEWKEPEILFLSKIITGKDAINFINEVKRSNIKSITKEEEKEYKRIKKNFKKLMSVNKGVR